MDDEAPPRAVDLVLLFLGDVVGDVVHDAHAELAGGEAQAPLEDLARPVREHLTVGEGEVGGGAHRAEVGARLVGVDGRTGQLPIGHADAVASERLAGRVEIVGADLVAEPARSRVDHDGHLALAEAERARRRPVVDHLDRLHLEEVIPRAERAELTPAALAGVRRHVVGHRAIQPAAGLDVLQIVRVAIPRAHRPGGAALEDSVERLRIERELAA